MRAAFGRLFVGCAPHEVLLLVLPKVVHSERREAPLLSVNVSGRVSIGHRLRADELTSRRRLCRERRACPRCEARVTKANRRRRGGCAMNVREPFPGSSYSGRIERSQHALAFRASDRGQVARATCSKLAGEPGERASLDLIGRQAALTRRHHANACQKR